MRANSVTWQKHPFKLLLYVEWALLGIALLTSVTLLFRPRHYLLGAGLTSSIALAAIAIIGFLGLRLPFNSSWQQIAYLATNIGLSWLAALLTFRGERILLALLLIVVIRGCLLLGWGGRIAIAFVAYGSYLAMQLMSWLRVSPFGIPLGRPIPRMLRRLPPEEARRVLFGLAFNSALLFALVIAFVLLLVSAVLAEHESQTKLKSANQQLRQYALKIENQAILQERNRIAREIHDSVGHYLTAQSIQLENTALFITSDTAKAQHHLQTARQLGKEALSSIRTSVATLRNRNKRSLSDNLKKLIARLEADTQLKIDAAIEPLNLPVETNTALYRIATEALTNVIKHSQATKVNLKLHSIPKAIELVISDNGCGFDPAQNTTGFGIQGMRERAAALNGDLQLVSYPGRTTITVTLSK